MMYNTYITILVKGYRHYTPNVDLAFISVEHINIISMCSLNPIILLEAILF